MLRSKVAFDGEVAMLREEEGEGKKIAKTNLNLYSVYAVNASGEKLRLY